MSEYHQPSLTYGYAIFVRIISLWSGDFSTDRESFVIDLIREVKATAYPDLPSQFMRFVLVSSLITPSFSLKGSGLSHNVHGHLTE